MTDLIQVLPDNLANQIAAGEVIQRPASAVKELLENAVDAAASHIQLIVSEAGKTLVQVIDNGKGMSETDARLCFERHATSKIRHLEDLFSIRTMGFRGEALASVAAVAQVEMRTRLHGTELGTEIRIENSVVTSQQPCACAPGTSISMKNLFFSIPARRNFLKSNTAELRHIIEEYIRVSMAFPDTGFRMTANGQLIYDMPAGNLKQRVLQVLGQQYNSKLVPVQEETDYLTINGFVGKPDAARKTRGDQYFFVNNRFIKSAYLNHAVNAAFGDLLPRDSFPMYTLFISLNPGEIDINVHPTKQEIKFEDEKIVYAFVQSAIRHALAQFSIAPSLDFSLNPSIQDLGAVQRPVSGQERTRTEGGKLYQTFTEKHQAHKIEGATPLPGNLSDWRSFLAPAPENSRPREETKLEFERSAGSFREMKPVPEATCVQLLKTYVVVPLEAGALLLHQQLAHERVVYERLVQAAAQRDTPSQRSLFPVVFELSSQDALLLQELLPELSQQGYEVEPFGGNSFVVQGSPADLKSGQEAHALELLLDQWKHFSTELTLSRREKLIRCLARQQSIKAGTQLEQSEMQHLVNDLLACKQPGTTPGGKPTYIWWKETYLHQLFGG